MIKQSSIFDVNSELLLQRFKHGVMLVKPLSRNESTTNSISNIFSIPTSVFFVESDQQRFIQINEGCAKIAGAQSTTDAIGKSADDFSDKQLSAKVRANNSTVISSERMIVIEECGTRPDDFHIQALSFKFPWYYDNKIIGIFGIGIQTTEIAIHKMADIMSQLICTGILGYQHSLPISLNPYCQNNNIYLTPRENEVISHLIRGKTAKEIGLRLSISNRTVETHIENIKLKTHSLSKSELINKLLSE